MMLQLEGVQLWLIERAGAGVFSSTRYAISGHPACKGELGPTLWFSPPSPQVCCLPGPYHGDSPFKFTIQEFSPLALHSLFPNQEKPSKCE